MDRGFDCRGMKFRARDLDLLLLGTLENPFCLTRLNFSGYFAPHPLSVPTDCQMVLFIRVKEGSPSNTSGAMPGF